jgi:hypothetical protein
MTMAMTEHQRDLTYKIAILVGATTAVCTLMMEQISGLPEAISLPLTAALFPGLLGGMVFAGNAHAFSLGGSAAVNFAVYFGLTWSVSFVAARRRRTPPETDAHS